MTSPFVQFFENVNFSSSYKGLSAHQIWFTLGQAKQSYGGGGAEFAPQVKNVLNRTLLIPGGENTEIFLV